MLNCTLLTSDSKHGNKCSIFGNKIEGQCLAISTRKAQQDLPPAISWLVISFKPSVCPLSAISLTMSSINEDWLLPDSTICRTVFANGNGKCSYNFSN